MTENTNTIPARASQEIRQPSETMNIDSIGGTRNGPMPIIAAEMPWAKARFLINQLLAIVAEGTKPPQPAPNPPMQYNIKTCQTSWT